MTNASKLCNFINDYPDDWGPMLTKRGIIIRKDETHPLALFHYSMFDSDCADPLVLEARGIIIRLDTLDVVCWPFNRFFDFDSPHADTLDFEHNLKISIKMDGTLISYWYNPFTEAFQFSTRMNIDARNNSAGGLDDSDQPYNGSFYDLILGAKNYRCLKECPYPQKDRTYVFELCSRHNKVVVPYADTMLYHICTRNNITGNECFEPLPVESPDKFEARFSCKDDLLVFANTLFRNRKTFIEGVVVEDVEHHRWKIKTDAWRMLHSFNTKKGREGIIEYVRTHNLAEVAKLMDLGIKEAAVVSFYYSVYSGFVYETHRLVRFVRKLERSGEISGTKRMMLA